MDFTNAALVVVDVNRTHFDMELNYLPVPAQDAERILDLLPAVVLPAFRRRGLPVVFVKTMHRQYPDTGTAMSVANPYWKYQMEKKAVTGVRQKRKALAVEGSPAVEIMPQLEKRPEDIVVVKQRYSPFLNTDMDLVLRALKVDTLFLVGANTNNCVLSTAFEAFNRDFKVVLVEDCCASMNGPDFHRLGVEQIRASLGWVIRSDQLESALSDPEFSL